MIYKLISLQPPTFFAYLDSGNTMYKNLATGLELYNRGVESDWSTVRLWIHRELVRICLVLLLLHVNPEITMRSIFSSANIKIISMDLSVLSATEPTLGVPSLFRAIRLHTVWSWSFTEDVNASTLTYRNGNFLRLVSINVIRHGQIYRRFYQTGGTTS